jgi:ribosomal protein L25 (general stress protein Ctc)
MNVPFCCAINCLLEKNSYLRVFSIDVDKNELTLIDKDNQATALLKEVAGTARTALGSTNSVKLRYRLNGFEAVI